MQILLVEDDIALAEGLKKALSREGFVINHVAEGQMAISTVRAESPDVVILDLGLPDMDGLSVLKQIRRFNLTLPVLILTARDNLQDKINGLDSGADDYLPKPFEMTELFARLRALARRLSSVPQTTIEMGEVTLDISGHLLKYSDKVVELSRHEYLLLKALMENMGRVLTRQNIESKIYSWNDEVASNALEVHIHHLRKKLPKSFITTVRGVGYTVRKT